MTVSASSYAPLLYNGNGSTTAFSVTFQFYTLLVTHIDSSGSETVWVENTQYTVSGGDGSTGTVNVKTTPTDYTPASGEQLRIERVTSQAQTEDFDFDNQVQEDSIQSSVDRNYMIMQELTYNNNRRPALSKSDYATLGALQFPAASANKAIGWNSDGDALVNIAQVDLDGVAITALTTTASLENADLFPLYDDSAGDNAAITFANLKTSLNLGALAALDTVDTAQIVADAITTAKITDANVTAAKLATDSVTTAKIVDDAVTEDKIVDGAVTADKLASGADTFGTRLLHVQDQKSAGTAGGTFTAGSFVTRVLNTVVENEITGASLSSNQITLPAGTYYIIASAPAYNCNQHKLILYNVTDTSNLIDDCQNARSRAASYVMSAAKVAGRFTIASEKVLDLRHRCETTQATTGLGLAVDLGVPEVYAEALIWKVA